MGDERARGDEHMPLTMDETIQRVRDALEDRHPDGRIEAYVTTQICDDPAQRGVAVANAFGPTGSTLLGVRAFGKDTNEAAYALARAFAVDLSCSHANDETWTVECPGVTREVYVARRPGATLRPWFAFVDDSPRYMERETPRSAVTAFASMMGWEVCKITAPASAPDAPSVQDARSLLRRLAANEVGFRDNTSTMADLTIVALDGRATDREMKQLIALAQEENAKGTTAAVFARTVLDVFG